MKTQGRLDLTRNERQAEKIDTQLLAKGVAPIQRAVIVMMVAHADVTIVDGNCRLIISPEGSAAWCRRYASLASGLKCPRSAILRARQVWVDRGVLAVVGRYWYLSRERLRLWFDARPDEDEAPVFSPVCAEVAPPTPAWPDTDCRAVAQGGAHCRAVAQGGAAVHPVQTLNEGMNELTHSFSQEGEPQAQLASLPNLPDELWSLKAPEDQAKVLREWWKERDLAAGLGIHANITLYALLGLVAIAFAKAKNPAAYYAKARRNPAPYVGAEGRRWMDEIVRLPWMRERMEERRISTESEVCSVE